MQEIIEKLRESILSLDRNNGRLKRLAKRHSEEMDKLLDDIKDDQVDIDYYTKLLAMTED